MSSERTRMRIAEALLVLANQKGLEKTSVSDIVSKSAVNRKTFYYHFSGKAELVIWLFRHDLAEALRKEASEDVLVYRQDDPATLAPLPYYTFIKVGVRSIDGAPFFRALDACFSARRDFYCQALASHAPDGLNVYLHDLYIPSLEHDVRVILGNRYLDESHQRFLAEFFVGAFVAYYAACLQPKGPRRPKGAAGPFGNLIHESIADEINRQQLSRAR